jgi:hypothetical protein
MHKTRGNPVNFVVDGLQIGQELLNTESAKSAAALDLGDMQSHVEGLDWGTDEVKNRFKAIIFEESEPEDPEF